MLFKVKKHLFVSFYKAWRVGIPITTQYDNIYVINEQFVTLAELIIGASSSQTCSLLFGQQEARALRAGNVSSAVPHSYSITM